MRQLKKNISLAIISVIILFLSSCLNKSVNEKVDIKEVQVIDTLEKSDSLIVGSVSQKTELIDLVQLKVDLDSFVVNEKRTQFPFDLNTDTVSVKLNDKNLWAFNKGIFELINLDSTELLVRHHFLIPKTKRILRLYLLELKFSNIAKCNSFFKKLVDRKDYKADLMDGIYMDYGLTGTTDYVIKIDKEILWLNVSCQYSKKDFTQIIEIFKQHIKLTETVEEIKCFCHEACE